jgi:hypothetical protein
MCIVGVRVCVSHRLSRASPMNLGQQHLPRHTHTHTHTHHHRTHTCAHTRTHAHPHAPTVPVDVSLMNTFASGTCSACATTRHIFAVCSPQRPPRRRASRGLHVFGIRIRLLLFCKLLLGYLFAMAGCKAAGYVGVVPGSSPRPAVRDEDCSVR